MAIYHYTVNGIAPARHGSPVASAAYQAGIDLVDEQTGKVCSYSRKERVREFGILVPSAAPAWSHDPQRLWNECMNAWRGGQTLAAVRREFALPRELTSQEQRELVIAYCKTRTSKGFAVQFSIHDSADENPHAHLIESATTLSKDGFKPTDAKPKKSQKAYLVRNAQGEEKKCLSANWKEEKAKGFEKVFNYINKQGAIEQLTKSEAKQRGLQNGDRKSTAPVSVTLTLDGQKSAYKQLKQELIQERKFWADIANEAIRKHNEQHADNVNLIDHRSNKERGIVYTPTIHEGYAARAMEARGDVSDRMEINRHIRLKNDLIHRLIELLKEVKNRALKSTTERQPKHENGLFSQIYSRAKKWFTHTPTHEVVTPPVVASAPAPQPEPKPQLQSVAHTPQHLKKPAPPMRSLADELAAAKAAANKQKQVTAPPTHGLSHRR